MSEKSTGNDLDYAVKSRMARHGTVFRSQMQFWPCRAAHEQYNASDSELKKEIPARRHDNEAIPLNCPDRVFLL